MAADEKKVVDTLASANVAAEEENPKTYRGLRDISDEELREAVEECQSFPELKRWLGINPDEKNKRVRARCKKAGCESLLNKYHVGKSSRIDNMAQEELQAIADECSTYLEFGEKLGYTGTGCSKSAMGKYVINKYNLSFQSPQYSKANLDSKRYNREYVNKIVQESHTFSEVGRKLGYTSGANIPNLLDKLNIDYSHFDAYYYHRGTRNTIEDFRENHILKSNSLKELLNSQGIVSCQICGCQKNWNEKEIHLEVHHRNGIHSDNRFENLMLLCPTCHAFVEHKGIVPDTRPEWQQQILHNKKWECEECHCSEWEGQPIPLEFHHKDGNNQNNSESNLMLLCPNCHSQTENFGCSKHPKRVSDDDYIKALSKNKTISESMKELGLSVTGSSYNRARKLAKENRILHIVGVDKDTIEDIIKIIKEEQDIKTVMHMYGLSIAESLLIVLGKHDLSLENVQYPLFDINKMDIKSYNDKGYFSIKEPLFSCQCCGKNISHPGLCDACNKKKRRSNIPSKQELKSLIRVKTFTDIGKKYGVSANAVVRWCKFYHLPYRKIDIDSFSDEEWEKLEEFSEDMKMSRTLYDHAAVIAALEQYRSAKYVSCLLNIKIEAIYDIRKQEKYNKHMIEWSKTTCHIVGTKLYFRTVADAGHWLAEHNTDMIYNTPKARGRKVKNHIDQGQQLFGYMFEYVQEDDYFDIIAQYKVISYAYQEDRVIPPQISKDNIE